MKQICKFLIVAVLILNFSACTNQVKQDNSILQTDYSKAENWVSIPTKQKYKVDVFYIYPTICLAKERFFR